MPVGQLIEKVQSACSLDKTRLIVVGVSGGPDSLCLLDVLCRLGYRLLVAHFDHGLRSESAEDAQKVERIAEERRLPYVSSRLNVAEFARASKQSIEEAARTARYRFLFAEARRAAAQAVAVAHTADDQVETVLMHFLRGTGLDGLRGMPYVQPSHEWDQTIPLVRPLLGIWRDEILEYCHENALQPLTDLTNADTTYHRNRLRHELIPYLAQFNPRIKAAIWRMSQNLTADHADLEQISVLTWKSLCLCEEQERVELSYPRLSGQSKGMQRRILRHGLRILRPGLRNIDFEAIERGVAFISSPPRSQKMDWVAGMWLSLQSNRLIISTHRVLPADEEVPQTQDAGEALLQVPGSLDLANGWKLTAELLNVTPSANTQYPSDNNEALLDADHLVSPLTVRPRLPGDRIAPLGMGGHTLKISDFFINAKLPEGYRHRYPLVISAGQVAWIPGYPPSHLFRITPQTTTAVRLRLIRTA
ncbi:MAG: tRNA lysidine(34) synthetase TilS [Anaerolineae bacterium]|nr:tRNA lysidine(34) synthetase TilS [Anaerolineae bacterium]